MKALTPIFLNLLLLACNSDPSSNNTSEKAIDEEVNSEITVSDSSEITCPYCGHTEIELLPTEVCLISYDCKVCGKTMHPIGDDCCVFCSYGTHECPSIQEEHMESR